MRTLIYEDLASLYILWRDTSLGTEKSERREVNLGTTWKLHKIYILATQQGKGTGKFVIDHIIKEIKLQGAIALQLQVNRNNKARSFYEKLGFVVIDEADFDIGNGYFMNDYVMEKKL